MEFVAKDRLLLRAAMPEGGPCAGYLRHPTTNRRVHRAQPRLFMSGLRKEPARFYDLFSVQQLSDSSVVICLLRTRVSNFQHYVNLKLSSTQPEFS
jgi:hypothetical protein